MHVLYRGVQSHSWCTSVLNSFDLNCLNTLSSKFLVIRNNLIGWFRSLIRIECKPEVSNSGPWGPMFLKVNLSQHTCLEDSSESDDLDSGKIRVGAKPLQDSGPSGARLDTPALVEPAWKFLKLNWPFAKTRPLSYCCYIQQAMALSRHTSCEKSCSTEETENGLTDKTEQVTFGMKGSLSFQILSFFK